MCVIHEAAEELKRREQVARLSEHFKYSENFTRPMQDALSQYLDRVEMMVRKDLELAKQLWMAGDVTLPMQAESGEPVVHGARMHCYRRAELFVARANMILHWLPRNIEDALRAEFRDLLKAFK